MRLSLVAIAFALILGHSAAQQFTRAVRLAVVPSAGSIRYGENASVRVCLRDTSNHDVRLEADTLESLGERGEKLSFGLHFNQSSAVTQNASNAAPLAALTGEIAVGASPSCASFNYPWDTLRQSGFRGGLLELRSVHPRALGDVAVVSVDPVTARIAPSRTPLRASARAPKLIRTALQQPPVSGEPNTLPTLALVYAPPDDRDLPEAGNPRSFAVIQAYLRRAGCNDTKFEEGGCQRFTAPETIHLVFSVPGRQPQELLIEQGRDVGTLNISSPGAATLEVAYQTSSMDLQLISPRRFKLHFSPLRPNVFFEALPKKIFQGESTELRFELRDPRDPTRKLVVQDGQKYIGQLEKDGASGIFTPKELVIQPGAFSATATFTPNFAFLQSGLVKVNLSTLVGDASEEVEVNFPLVTVILSVLGGILGALVSLSSRLSPVKGVVTKTPWRQVVRVLVGGVSGFFLLWALVYGLMPWLPQLSAPLHQLLTSPIPTLLVSIVGGFGGASVIANTYQRLFPGVQTAPPSTANH
jgi:hypothetical protein